MKYSEEYKENGLTEINPDSNVGTTKTTLVAIITTTKRLIWMAKKEKKTKNSKNWSYNNIKKPMGRANPVFKK